MATQGWYNHYDDPDEFWDEAPLTRPPLSASKASDPVGISKYSIEPRVAVPARPDQEESTDDVDHRALSDSAAAAFTAWSLDSRASVTVSPSGFVRDIHLTGGLCNRNDPSWLVSQDIDSTARAIMEAVNSARRSAAEASSKNVSAGGRG